MNYWALIVGILTTRISRVGMTYAMHPYRPRFGLAAWRAITGFSVWSWVISIADLLRERSDSLVIGRLLNTTEVGVYAIGMEIASLPTTELVEPLGRACFSGFSAARHAGLSLSDTYMRVISITALLDGTGRVRHLARRRSGHQARLRRAMGRGGAARAASSPSAACSRCSARSAPCCSARTR